MRTRHIFTGTLLALALGAGAAFGETVWIKSASVQVRQGKAAIYPAVGTLNKGAEATVLSRDGDWVQLSSGQISGWVSTASVSTSKVNGDVNLGFGGTAQMGTGAASRGLVPGAEAYVASRNVNKQPLENLMALRKNIPTQTWVDFARDVHR